MSYPVSLLPLTLDCNEVYEDAICLFSCHDDELEKIFKLTKPVFNTNITVSLNSDGKEQYSIKTLLSFPNCSLGADMIPEQEIMEQKFRGIENIINLEQRLNDALFLKSDR